VRERGIAKGPFAEALLKGASLQGDGKSTLLRVIQSLGGMALWLVGHRARLIAGAPLLVLVAACGGGNAASQLAKAPDYDPKDQTKCGVAKSQERPLIVEWPSADRLELESKARQGIVAVRYVGCEMDVLERCSVPAKYNYVGGTRKQDELDINNEDDLYANLPVGAAKLEGRLERSGKLTVKMDLVGRYESERASVRVDELQGDCAGATHFIYGVTLGAFDFYAGGEAQVGGSAGVGSAGAGGHSQADGTSITKDGDPDACSKSTEDDKVPPSGCRALIRIEVVPLAAAATSSAPPPAGPQTSPAVNASPAPAPASLVAVGGSTVTGNRLHLAGPIEFDAGKATLRSSAASDAALQTLSDFMRQNRQVTKLRVENHTDSVGSAEENVLLSQARAEAVTRWLVAHGVDQGRLVASGVGGTQPLVPDDTVEHRAMNRRTELVIVEINGQPAN
jgi:outer membrane protein OmpA-like peptidoglycan-associated protein